MHTKARVQINSKSGNFVMTGCVPITFWCRLADQWAALDVNHPHLSTFPQPERENLFFFLSLPDDTGETQRHHMHHCMCCNKITCSGSLCGLKMFISGEKLLFTGTLAPTKGRSL